MRGRLCCRRMRNAIGRKDIKVHEDVASMSPGLLLFSTSKAQLWMFRCHGRSLSLMLCFIMGKNRANKSHNTLKMRSMILAELFNSRVFGLPSRQHKKDIVFLMAVQASFPKELDFLSIPRPDCLPRNAHSFYNP